MGKFLKVDYSQIEPIEKMIEKQMNCDHKVVEVLDVNKADVWFFGIPKRIDVVDLLCLDCKLVYSKEIKNKKLVRR